MPRIAFHASSLILVHVFFFSSLHCILHSSFFTFHYILILFKKKEKKIKGGPTLFISHLDASYSHLYLMELNHTLSSLCVSYA